MNDAATRAAAPKNSRPSDKRKKRKLKKKKQAPKEPQETSLPTLETTSNVNLAIEPDSPQAPVPLSPRKQTLMRHRKSDAFIEEPLFISEVKELKKNRRPSPAPVDAAGYRKFSLDLSNQTVEDKTTLFKCAAARIVTFHEQLNDTPARASSGTLLGHGEFEIFQLHNGDVTYLACGRLFVYPLLPKLKMLRIDKNLLILPLVNPQRYWKIHIDSDDMSVISELEAVLKKIVNYTNLSLPENGIYRSSTDSIDPHNVDADPEKDSEEKHSGAVENDSKGKDSGTSLEKDSVERTSEERDLMEKTSVEIESPATGHYTPFFNDIPELPPSAPVSPSNLNLFVQDNFQLPPVKQPLFPMAQKPKQSITSSFATFNMAAQQRNRKNGPLRNDPHQQEPSIHANPYRKDGHDLSDHHSDLSSMDSLLDEYEENISTTKSINFNISRPPSRAISVATSSHPPQVQYQRGRMAVFPDRSINAGSHYGTVEQEEEEDDFPTTSLSHYNKAHQNSRSARSRRSSRSELYSSVSNWMEPGPKNVLAHSRSNYSLASRHSNVRAPNLNETYREIYRSITLNNLSLVASGRDKETAQKDNTSRGNAAAKGQSGPYYSKLLESEQGPRKRGEVSSRERKSKPDGFSSNEVYRLLSSREQGPEKRSTIGRFFGW